MAEAEVARRKSTTLKVPNRRRSGACGSIDGTKTSSPLILRVRKKAETDFQIFTGEITERLETRKTKDRKTVRQKFNNREYDTTNKVLPPSQDLDISLRQQTPKRNQQSEHCVADKSGAGKIPVQTKSPVVPFNNESSNSEARPTKTDQNTTPTSPKDSNEEQITTTTTTLPNDLSERVVSSDTMDNPVQFLMNNSRTILEELSTSDELPIIIEYIKSDTANLPPYAEINSLPDTNYNNVSPELFVTNINKVYEEMVTWRKNLFLLPTGKAGKSFIKLISEWLCNFNNANTFQGIALKVVMILPNLLLQKPSSKSKAKEHSKALEERLKMWSDGKINELLRDCRAIQTKLKSGKRKTTDDITRVFSKLIFEGKIGAALKYLDENADDAVLQSSDAIINKLKLLHPPAAEILPHTVLQGPLNEISTTTFDSINEQEILKAANQTKGSGGPSLLDAKQWRRILSSKQFKGEGKDLREELARFAKKIATEIVDPSTLNSYTASRSIPLNKTPGETDPQVRPIGVGEVLRRIVGKTISWALSDEIQAAGGSLQVSTGLKGGSEAAIHAMKEIFDQESTEAVILVDAENAFNKLNRQAALHNMQYLCPPFATVLINTYRNPTRLFITGGGEIASIEGTTQGDTLAMQFYGISTTPIINTLSHYNTTVHQVWLADDATGAGTLADLKNWWDLVTFEGRKYGYHVKPSKSWLILKDENKLAEAEKTFKNSPIKITTAGKRHLGAALGTEDFKISYMTDKINEWCGKMRTLSELAKTQPHAAYAAYIHGEQHKYTYFLRTINNISELLKPLDNIISNEFIPSLFGSSISPRERDLFALPIKDGGLGLRIWHDQADDAYNTSKNITTPLQTQIIKQTIDLPPAEDVEKAKDVAIIAMREKVKNNTTSTTEQQNNKMKRNLEQLAEPGASSWLSAFPLKDQGFNLNKSEFNDAMCLRYDKTLKNLPSKCPCGKPFTVTHAMNCHRGGFINSRHDSIRNFEARLLKEVCKDVQIEPPLQTVEGNTFQRSTNVRDDARLDVRAKGFWREGQNAFFDIRVTNADNASQKDKPLKSVLRSHEQEKKRNYNTRVMEVEQGTFTPIVLTIKGVMGPEAICYHKTLAEKISTKTGEQYGDVTRLIRIKASFLVLRAALLCLRGSRTMYNNTSGESCEDFALTLNEIGLR